MVSLKSIVIKLIGTKTKEVVKRNYSVIKFRYVYPLYQQLYVKWLRHREQINIVFIASSLSMWRYQRIYEFLRNNSRFKVSVVIIPFSSYSKEQQEEDIKKLKAYFDFLQIQYYIGNDSIQDIKKELSPHILFYPQPYEKILPLKFDYRNFRRRLLCYNPYAFWMSKGDWSYNLPLHNYAWKLFYSTELHLKDAKSYAYNKGCNVEVVGYPNADIFLNENHKDVWKKQNKYKKRIIWAPHFTIFTGGYTNQSNFLWLADFMLDIAGKYVDSVQIAFKPHPKLRTALYKHPEWGKDKTESYYKAWETMGNTQLETGEFIDLFMTSDAMIHDSGSFCVEYHYTKRPVMYIARDFEKQVSDKGEFGQMAMKLHYVANCEDDIVNFIENVVLKGDDPMKQGREYFFKQYLLPPNGKSVAENTVDILLKELS